MVFRPDKTKEDLKKLIVARLMERGFDEQNSKDILATVLGVCDVTPYGNFQAAAFKP